MVLHIDTYVCNQKGETYAARVDYSPYSLHHAKKLIKSGVKPLIQNRPLVCGVTIDGASSKDLDDAIFCEKYENGYFVQIHIANPTAFIDILSPLDIEALKRTTSIYRNGGVLNMYPPELANNLFSLDENGKKLTMTVEIDLDVLGNIKNYKIFESVFSNDKRYDYENFTEDFLNPDSQQHTQLHALYELAKKRKLIRKNAGAIMDFDEADRRMFLGEKEQKYPETIKKIPHIIVEECAILANYCAADFLKSQNGLKVFRSHLDADERAFYSGENMGHIGLALEKYMHFTSPIRRYADGIAHRIISSILKEKPLVYKQVDIEHICRHINNKATIILTVGKLYDKEIWGESRIKMLKSRHGDGLKTHHFKDYIRHHTHKKLGLPENMRKKILEDIKTGDISDRSWCIGVFLISDETEIKKTLKTRLIEKKDMEPKKILSILCSTKVIRGETSSLFSIIENISDIAMKLDFYFRDKKIISLHENFENKNAKKEASYYIKKEMVEKIFEYFI